ncbi:MAG TPA: hypothetical protein PKE39_04375 [Ignavibacteria bacterium]|nr:hypothetical protein [Ignavibacteria bacterium]HMQ98238.1 hypothetical protein [Ignavibacteria bacterium]
MNPEYTPNENTEEINCWAFVEIFGHTKLSGRVSTKKLGANIMLQVDVPKGETEFSHSELFSPASIFSIKPTTEEWCRKFAAYRVNHDVLPYIPQQRQIPESTTFETDIEEEL